MSDVKGETGVDPYLWLEEVTGEKALAWVEGENARSVAELTSRSEFAPLQQKILDILSSDERIPQLRVLGPWYYNFWQDQTHVRGILRRTTPEEFRKRSPAWETVLDLDALAAAEGKSWVWAGMSALWPAYQRFLIRLSEGGGDAVTVREFDVGARQFVADGFTVPPAKTQVDWIDADTIYVASDFGPGSLTASGYPRITRRWKRGQALEAAQAVFEGRQSDVAAGVAHVRTWVGEAPVWHELAQRSVTFHTSETFLLQQGAWVKLDVPEDAEAGLFQDLIIVTLKSDWTLGDGEARKTWPQGAVLAMPLAGFLTGARDFTQLYEPGERKSLRELVATRHHLLVHEMDDMREHVREWSRVDGGLRSRATSLPTDGTLSLGAVDSDASDDYFFTHADALTPTALWVGHAARDGAERLKVLPAFFDAEGMRVSSYDAISRDGTRVPYCVLTPRDFQADGTAPTLLYGYGGFEISLLPLGYGAVRGVGWLSRGGVFVIAGVRGGGEFGPAWHQAALRARRQVSFDDFIAVAEDLVARKITSPAHLGIQGGSNGGLLVGAVMVQRPELFGAVVSQVPLMDMQRFHLLHAGASWVGEYGDPGDPAERAALSQYSPYHNVRAGIRYPRALFTTSTRDDRVHPGHARKMVARMKEQGHDVLYFENTEGGHALSTNNLQAARVAALELTFLWEALR
jgi:prolyl oligopeptidase